MAYYAHSSESSLKISSSVKHQRSSRTFQNAHSTTDVLTSLITFYRDEQYWIRRARTAISLHRDTPRTGQSDSSSASNDVARVSSEPASRSPPFRSPPWQGTSTGRARYKDLERLVLPSNVDEMNVDGSPEPPKRGRPHDIPSVGGLRHEDHADQGSERTPLPFELRTL